MKVQTEIKRWGNGLGLHVTGLMRKIPDFVEGSKVIVDISEERLVIEKIPEKNKKTFPYSEEMLLDGITDSHGFKEILPTISDEEWQA